MASRLPEQDPYRPAEQQGLFRKFDVRRFDGSDRPGGKHYDCEYLVLDVTHDKHAKAALSAYADSVGASHPQLASDMRKRYELGPYMVQARPRNEAVDIPADSAWQFPMPRTWHSGPPPHVGWWNASSRRNHNTWRWWDGGQWSYVVRPDAAPDEVARGATLKVGKAPLFAIEWTGYWPANARVPRTPAEGTRWRARDTGDVFIVTRVLKNGLGVFISAQAALVGHMRYHGYDSWLRDFDPVETK